MKKYNFYSGPAMLPPEVLEQAQDAIGNFAGTGLSILEISHRSKEFVKVMDEARVLVKEVLQIDSNYEVLFLQGGASTQFCMVPYNLLNQNETAGYLDTGQWANLAMQEAASFGKVSVVASSKEEKYIRIPQLSKEAWIQAAAPCKYLHLTTNNTIYGTQLHYPQLETISQLPGIKVADMSSDIFSRQIDFNGFDLIYAGAQKNFGCAGTTLVAVNKDVLGVVERNIPKMLDYRVHIAKESMHNTPSVFAVYVSYLTLQWIKKVGLKSIEARNQRKAEKLYHAIDASNLFEGTVATTDRSLMNVCFGVKDKLLEEKFLAYANQQGMVGIKGYRSVGGFRASIYNAMPEDGVDALVQVMNEFERTV